jgi:LacI family transcriptional regulator
MQRMAPSMTLPGASPYSLVLTNLSAYKASWSDFADDFPPAEWPVDGIFAFKAGALPQRIMDRRPDNPPVIWMDYEGIPNEFNADEVDSVIVRPYKACEDAVRHLVPGRRRVAFLGLSMFMEHPENARVSAYTKVLSEAGLKPEFIPIPLRRPFGEHARLATIEYVQQHGCPDAIFCASDEQTPGVHLGLSQAGYRVPEDVALVGFDGLEHTEYHVPPLSTIVQPFDAMCRTAWQFMQNRLANPDTPHQYAELDMEFLPRESSRPIASASQSPEASPREGSLRSNQ